MFVWRGHWSPREPAETSPPCVSKSGLHTEVFPVRRLRPEHKEHRILAWQECRRFGGGCEWVWDDPCHAFEWHQPLGFDSLTLRRHSNFVILIDKAALADTIKLTGVVQYHRSPERLSGLRSCPALAKYFRVHDGTALVD